jgi:hypothetical protein
VERSGSFARLVEDGVSVVRIGNYKIDNQLCARATQLGVFTRFRKKLDRKLFSCCAHRLPEADNEKGDKENAD